MIKLIRPLIENFLSHYQPGINRWKGNCPTVEEKWNIWQHFADMQNGYCAYCESKISQGKDKGHIEHFFHKGKLVNGVAIYQHLTFDWNNLFGSCDSNFHCGHFKDNDGTHGPGEYDANELIKPDIFDPKKYFIFLSTGYIKIRSDLVGVELKKATETVRVFNLEHSTLINSRKNIVKYYNDQMLMITQNISVWPTEKTKAEIAKLKEAINKSEYQTAIKQSFKKPSDD